MNMQIPVQGGIGMGFNELGQGFGQAGWKGAALEHPPASAPRVGMGGGKALEKGGNAGIGNCTTLIWLGF